MTIYLMVKTHLKTGLKYLCKTTRNPFEYAGSGKDWIQHLEKCGYDHNTEIVKICYSKEELNYFGRYYSRLWNVVDAMDNFGNKIWANRIPETGGGWGKAGPRGKQKNPSGPRGKQKNPARTRKPRGAMPEKTKEKLRVPKGKQKNPSGPRGAYGKQKNPAQKLTCKCGVSMHPGRFSQLGHGDNCNK